MRIRPIHPSDAPSLQSFHMAQSERSQYFRFFAPMARLSDADLHRFTNVDYTDRVALVLVSGDEIAAVGRYDRLVGDRDYPDGDVAEVAFNVSDQSQGRGLGSVLLEHLAAAGRERGIRRFVADVLPSNTRMLRVFSDAGYDVKQRFDDGVVTVNFTIRPTDKSMKVLAERERRAEALSMGRILAATSVLFYGAGSEGSALARAVRAQVEESAFHGEVLEADSPAALTAGLEGREGPLDLAVVGAPAAEVLEIIPALGEASLGALLILTGGFSTTAGEEGVPQSELLRAVRQSGIRLVGPRSYGVLARGDHGPLPALLAPETPITAEDGIGIFCQSSTAARALLAGAKERRLPLSTALVAGHRADVSGNDTMQFWAGDERTRVACVHLESIGNPRKFSRVARHLARDRPVIAAIAGRSGQVRAPGHPVRETNTPRRALEELMNQAGVLRARSVPQQLDWAMAFSSQPLPAGDRVAVLANSGTYNVVLQELITATGADPVGGIPALNPVAGVAEYEKALTDLAARRDWDAAVLTYGPYLGDAGEEIARLVAAFARDTGRTVVAHIHGLTGVTEALTDGEVRVPAFASGEDAIDALAAMRSYASRRDTEPSPRVDPPGIDRRSADALIAEELSRLPVGERRLLTPTAAKGLLACYGLDVLPATTVASVQEAVVAAEETGWPVALKTADAVLRHRADLGGVRLDLGSAEELRVAYEAMASRISGLGRSAQEKFEVQAMAPTGAACVLVAEEDPLYGPIVSFGLGGDAIELLEDVSYRVPPLTEADAVDLITSVKAAPRLLGHRDLPPLFVEGLIDVVARLSVLKEELAPIARVELNPVLVAETTVAIISADVVLAHPARGDIARRVLPE